MQSLPLIFALSMLSAATLSHAQSTDVLKIDASEREQLNLTLYNQNLGLVTETRAFPAISPQQTIVIDDVSGQLQANTLQVRNAGKIIEQNHNTDLLSYKKLLSHYQGKELTLVQHNQNTGSESKENVRLLTTSDDQVLIERNGQLENIPLNGNWRFIFPEIPADLSLKPSISIRSTGTEKPASAEISYLTTGLSWHTDYVLTLDKSGEHAALTGLATLNNNTGSHFSNATINLLAGNVNQPIPRAVRRQKTLMMADGMQAEMAMSAAPQRESLQNFYLYTLPYPVNLLNNQKKQVNLMSAEQVKLSQEFQLQTYTYAQPQTEQQRLKPTQQLVIENSSDNALGEPIPAGTVRVFKPDSRNQLQFVGGSNIHHTAANQDIKVKLGQAFDLSIDQKQTVFDKVMGGYKIDQQFTIHNSANKTAILRLANHFNNRWEISNSSESYSNKGRAAEWLLEIAPGEKKQLKFSVKLFKD